MTNHWRLRYSRVIGPVLVAVFVVIGLFGPLTLMTSPLKTNPDAIFLGPSPKHPFGTDNLGRDILAGIVWGAQTALLVGVLSVGGAILLGVPIGGLAGYFGGLLDNVLVRVTELFIVIPRLFLAMILVAFFGTNIFVIIATLAVTGWPQVARLVRAEFIGLRSKEFVYAAVAMGANDARVMIRHMLPNAMPTLIVNASLQVSAAILLEAGLAFFGLSDPDRVSWGSMLSTAQQYLRVTFWMPFFPGLALAVTALGLNLLGDMLTEMYSPRLRTGTLAMAR